jgi:general stress protein 26
MSQETDRNVLWDLIKHIRFCMLSHRHGDGTLHSHPLTTQNKDLSEGNIYFFVSKATEVGQRLAADGNVNLAYADPDKDCYVSITGLARVVNDRAKVEELFNPIAKAWFPGGVDDPNLELVAVELDEAEYWNVKENKLVQLFKMAKAAVTGTTPKHMGEHREVQLG